MVDDFDLMDLHSSLDQLANEYRDKSPQGRAIARTAERLKTELAEIGETDHEPGHINLFKDHHLKITGHRKHSVMKNEVYAVYEKWAQKHGFCPVTQTKLSRELQNDRRVGHKSQAGDRYYTGLKLTE